ncbi:hypothetical protein B0H12DRAFT_542422 [Mycena haematopus]|nr:hypothetical protein B0H12DRAFT_542422 [Mycena haematopus]
MTRAPSRSSLPTNVCKRGLELTACAETCFEAASAVECGFVLFLCPFVWLYSPVCGLIHRHRQGGQLCFCTNADFQSKWFSCIQGECQPDELDNADKWLASACLGRT